MCNPPRSAPSHQAGLEPGIPAREAGALPRRLKATVGAPRIVTTFHPSSDGPEYKLLRARVGLGLVTLIRCQARAGQGLERLGPGPG